MKAIGHALRAVCFVAIGAGTLLAEPTAEPTSVLESRQLSAAIDREIEVVWQAAAVTPAAPASDAEFLRRVYLDLVGAIPPVSVVRDFLEDNSSDKRSELVDRLLNSPRHTTHFRGCSWRGWLPRRRRTSKTSTWPSRWIAGCENESPRTRATTRWCGSCSPNRSRTCNSNTIATMETRLQTKAARQPGCC